MSVGAGTILANGKDPQIVIAVHIDLRSYGVCENGMLITGKLLTHGFGMDLDGFRWIKMVSDGLTHVFGMDKPFETGDRGDLDMTSLRR